ncbi:uncharacterized protein LOC129569432 [Sitodiplosis mosellana]|uniref:uncharacterized protein LOC129569432 n=1 Tax=Sitodiplosis mosellana TaxID=263140 RepID=UPI002444848D|nr:uncharacterized protein LOC129569432 [Sitodiplosis mosellana]
MHSAVPTTCPKCRASVTQMRRLFLHQVDVTPENSSGSEDNSIAEEEIESDADSIDTISEDSLVPASDEDTSTTEEEEEVDYESSMQSLRSILDTMRRSEYGRNIDFLSALDRRLDTTINELREMGYTVDGLWDNIRNERASERDNFNFQFN